MQRVASYSRPTAPAGAFAGSSACTIPPSAVAETAPPAATAAVPVVIFLRRSRRFSSISVSYWNSLVRFLALGLDLAGGRHRLRQPLGSHQSCPAETANNGACESGSGDSDTTNWHVDQRVRIRRRHAVHFDRLEDRHSESNVLFCATDARSTDSNRPDIGGLVKVPRGACCMRNRPFAAHLVKAPSLPMTFVAELFHKSAVVKVSTTRAMIVDKPIEGELRPVVLIECRQPVHRRVLQHHGQQVIGVRRATGQVHHRFRGEDGIHALCTGRIRVSRRHTAPCCARSHGDHGSGFISDLVEYVNGWLARQLHVLTFIFGGY